MRSDRLYPDRVLLNPPHPAFLTGNPDMKAFTNLCIPGVTGYYLDMGNDCEWVAEYSTLT